MKQTVLALLLATETISAQNTNLNARTTRTVGNTGVSLSTGGQASLGGACDSSLPNRGCQNGLRCQIGGSVSLTQSDAERQIQSRLNQLKSSEESSRSGLAKGHTEELERVRTALTAYHTELSNFYETALPEWDVNNKNCGETKVRVQTEDDACAAESLGKAGEGAKCAKSKKLFTASTSTDEVDSAATAIEADQFVDDNLNEDELNSETTITYQIDTDDSSGVLRKSFKSATVLEATSGSSSKKRDFNGLNNEFTQALQDAVGVKVQWKVSAAETDWSDDEPAEASPLGDNPDYTAYPVPVCDAGAKPTKPVKPDTTKPAAKSKAKATTTQTQSQPANQPQSQPANQPQSQPANQPQSQPANQPQSQPANQPQSQPTNNSQQQQTQTQNNQQVNNQQQVRSNTQTTTQQRAQVQTQARAQASAKTNAVQGTRTVANLANVDVEERGEGGPGSCVHEDLCGEYIGESTIEIVCSASKLAAGIMSAVIIASSI